MRLAGKVALITGAGGGQGRAAAQLFAREGARVVVNDWDAKGGEETVGLVEKEGGQAVFVQGDVSKAADVEAAVNTAVKRYGGLHVLYNNAGVWFIAPEGYVVGKTDAPSPLLAEEIWQKTIDVNLKGTYLCCKYGIPAMAASGGGSIINVSSIAAIRTGGKGSSDAYTATKGGVMAMTRTLAVEHASLGIRCNVICPGAIRTAMVGPLSKEREQAATNSIPLGRWGTPEDVAYLALYLASDESSFMTGSVLVIDGGFTAS